MMLESPPDETVEVSATRWIVLSFAREWPRFVVDWSVRQRHGDSDFPVVGGRVVREPERDRPTDEIWNEVRDQAVEEANQALGQQGIQAQKSDRGLFARLFRRNG